MKLKDHLAANSPGIAFLAVFSIAMLFVFFPILSPWTCITSPDDGPFIAGNRLASSLESMLAGKGGFTPFLFCNLFAQIGLHEFRYVLCMLLFGASGAYYLRTVGIVPLAAYGGGLFLAFSGYIFTLFSAGHIGFFWLMGGFFWSFGLLNRCFQTGQLRHFILLGAVVMWAQPGQPDVWMVFALLFGFYGLMRFWQNRTQLIPLLPKFLLAGLVAGLIGAASIQTIFSGHLAARDKQIADVSQAADAAGAQHATDSKTSEDRWNFATGWSLPPADCAELLIPGFFGNDSMRPPYPYWGALGRPHAFQKGKMMPNYRQHTTYLGLITVFMALLGICGWRSWRRHGDGTDSPAQPTTASFADVPFWVAVGVICLIFALGRYTPVYRLFYSIPYMDYLRAPVKFLHVTELATGLLGGFGLQALLNHAFTETTRRRISFASWGLVLLLVIVTIAVFTGGTAIEKHIAELGLGQVAPALRGYTLYNCLRAIGLAVGLAVLLHLWRHQRRDSRKTLFIMGGIILLSVSDLASVARRYVIPVNVHAFHAENAVTKELRQRTRGRPANVANYATRNVFAQDWLNTALTIHGFANILPGDNDPNVKENQIASAFQNDPLRHWDVMGVRFLLLPYPQANPLIQQHIATGINAYDLGNGTVRTSVSPTAQSILLLERNQPAFPAVYFNWTGAVAHDQQIGHLTQSGVRSPVTDAPSPAMPNERPPQTATFLHLRGERDVLVSHATLDLPQSGLLIWNERYTPDLVATLDGKEIPLHQANGVWCAAQIPAGRHALACRVRITGGLNILSAGTSLIVLVAVGIQSLWRTKK